MPMTIRLRNHSKNLVLTVIRIEFIREVAGVYGMNALQLILEDLSTDHEERLQAIVDILVESFLPRLADQACVDVFELQTSLATEL